MENQLKQSGDPTSTIPHKRKSIGTEILFLVAFIITTLGIISSIAFAQTIERFFWQIRANSVAQEATETGNRLLVAADINGWQKEESQKKLGAFSSSIKHELPNVLAIKIFTLDGTVAWSDIPSIKTGSDESILTGQLETADSVGIAVDIASVATKQQLGKNDVLDVYVKIKTSAGQPYGFVDFYLENSDIASFVNKIHYTILASIFIMLAIGVYIIRFAFLKQDDIIVRQAHELSDIVEQSPFGIYTINTKGEIISINSRMLEILKESDASRIIGKICWELNSVQNVCKEAPVEEALQGKPFDIETNSLNQTGEEIHYRYRGIPLFSENNRIVEEVLFTVEDITERKNLEENLKTHAKILEEGVSERTKQLQNKITELEQFQRLTINRELRMTELKNNIEKLRAELKKAHIPDPTQD